jgi:hypothetical protein
MLSSIGKLAMNTTLTLGSAWLASITYCKLSTFMNNNNNAMKESYKINKTGLGVSMLMGATIGLGSAIIFNNNIQVLENINNMQEVMERCAGD